MPGHSGSGPQVDDGQPDLDDLAGNSGGSRAVPACRLHVHDVEQQLGVAHAASLDSASLRIVTSIARRHLIRSSERAL